MTTDGVRATAQTVRQLLTSGHYEIPVYQRKYSWDEEEIRQLIDDLNDAASDDETKEYFLGNIVVSSAAHHGTASYSLIDGQQRLTTLHLLFTYLLTKADLPALRMIPLSFECRPGFEEAPATPPTAAAIDPPDPGILNGYRIIEQYSGSAELLNHLDFVLDNVLVARLELPEGTDLNRYFEVMNTRGEQLQQPDIVKARMMATLASDDKRTDGHVRSDRDRPRGHEISLSTLRRLLAIAHLRLIRLSDCSLAVVERRHRSRPASSNA